MASFARFCPGTPTGRLALLTVLGSFARFLHSSREPSGKLPFWQDWVRLLFFHEPSWPVGLPFWQDWLRLLCFAGPAEDQLKPLQPEYSLQINIGFVSQIHREPTPIPKDQMIDRVFPD
jgi:hypothetical protein